jgi:hypothetical protein
VLAQRERDVLSDVHRVEQRGPLEHHPELGAEHVELLTPQGRDVLPVDEHAPPIRREQPDDVLHQHRLAAARAAEDHRRRPRGEVEVDALQHGVVAEALVELFDADHGLRARPVLRLGLGRSVHGDFGAQSTTARRMVVKM